MFIILLISFIIILTGALLLFVLSRQKSQFGILGKEKILYQDTEAMPGENLYAKTIPLVGKPDYLVKQGVYIIPVEKKKGKAPRDQYTNHNMQLMAYCLLVEENFNVRPPGGYLKYEDKELPLQYTKEAEEAVRIAVKEILEHKKTNKEIHCNHQQHYT